MGSLKGVEGYEAYEQRNEKVALKNIDQRSVASPLYRGTSPTRKRPPLQDPHRTPGIGLR